MSSAAVESADQAPKVLTTKTLGYHFSRVVTGTACGLLWRPRYEGVDNLPATGRCVILANHQSFIDIPLISAAGKKRHLCFVARDTLARSKVVAWLLRTTGAVLIKRGQPDRAALREMVAHLEAEDALVIFPEGTRTHDGRVQAFHGGALLAARLTKSPIIPTGMRGAFEAWPRHSKRPHITRVAVRFGAPIDPALPDALERAHAAIDAMVGAGRFDSVPPVR